MPLACIGISHARTPSRLRDAFATSLADLHAAYRDLWPSLKGSGVAEVAILATCNRVELYAAPASPAQSLTRVPRALGVALGALGGMDASTLEAHAYASTGAAALRHLCRVAGGLESLILGEAEVLGQVGSAHDLGAEVGAVGPILEAAFRTAIRAGRRARAETAIGRNPLSIAAAAVHLAREHAGDLSACRTLVLGSGSMGKLALQALQSAGARRQTIVSRTLAHAQAAAEPVGATPLAWHELGAALESADVVICATGAPHPVVPAALVRKSLGETGRSLLLVDIAMPHDVEPDARDVPGVRVLDMDDLEERLKDNLARRRAELPAAVEIIEEELGRFEEWRRGAALRPLLSALRAHGDGIRRRELERLLRRLGAVSPALQGELARFSESLTSKLLHEPTQRLRAETDPLRCDVYVEATRHLFGLSDHDQALGELLASEAGAA